MRFTTDAASRRAADACRCRTARDEARSYRALIQTFPPGFEYETETDSETGELRVYRWQQSSEPTTALDNAMAKIRGFLSRKPAPQRDTAMANPPAAKPAPKSGADLSPPGGAFATPSFKPMTPERLGALYRQHHAGEKK